MYALYENYERVTKLTSHVKNFCKIVQHYCRKQAKRRKRRIYFL